MNISKSLLRAAMRTLKVRYRYSWRHERWYCLNCVKAPIL